MKKKYTIPPNISSEISNTIDLVTHNIGTLNYNIIPISIIEFDPENPRDLSITREDILHGLSQEDPLYNKKMQELESLKQTAETIKRYGVRNAVEVYRYKDKYRLIHGERRCLSSILAERKDIPAKILNEKPNDFDIRLLQLIENVQRKDLTLYETLNNIRQVIQEYKNHVDPTVQVDATFLEQLINRSKSHCFNFLAILNAPDSALHEAIEQRKISSLEKAAIIARAKTQAKKDTLMKSCLEGASLKQLKSQSLQHKKLDSIASFSNINLSKKNRPGKKLGKINLGVTTNKNIVARIVRLVLDDPLYSTFRSKFDQVSFEDYSECTTVFSSLIRMMEKIE